MADYGKCGYCGTDTTLIAELRTDARFCSKEHQKAYWTDKRRLDRTRGVALDAIHKLQEFAASDTLLAQQAREDIAEIVNIIYVNRSQ